MERLTGSFRTLSRTSSLSICGEGEEEEEDQQAGRRPADAEDEDDGVDSPG